MNQKSLSFTKAVRRKSKLRLAISGPSGSGKTYSALLLAKGMGGKIAVIDTERGSASLYSHLTDFDVLELEPKYTPERFIEAIAAAESAGYETLIIDSLSHEWSGVGGCLELVDEIARTKYRGNAWSAWNDITPRHRALLDAILRSPMHIIACMRSKTETQQEEKDGKKRVVKLGMKDEQREGTEYEFTIKLELSHDGHYAMASKDRTGLFARDPAPLTVDDGQRCVEWLNSGAEMLPEQKREDPGSGADDLDANDPVVKRLKAARTMDELGAAWEKLTADQRRKFADVKDRRKAELNRAAEADPLVAEMDAQA